MRSSGEKVRIADETNHFQSDIRNVGRTPLSKHRFTEIGEEKFI